MCSDLLALGYLDILNLLYYDLLNRNLVFKAGVGVCVTTFENYILKIDCNKAENRLKTRTGSQCALNALAIDEPYARLALEGNLQMWISAEDSLEVW